MKHYIVDPYTKRKLSSRTYVSPTRANAAAQKLSRRQKIMASVVVYSDGGSSQIGRVYGRSSTH